MHGAAAASSFRQASPMAEATEPWLRRSREAGLLDHRHRHRLLPRRRAGRALAGARRRRSRRVDATSFAPYIVHPLAPINFDAQIPKKGDQRQMEPWQRIGTYAAGLALDSAGVKGNAEIPRPHGHDRRGRRRRARSRGRRRHPHRPAAKAADAGRFLNERLMNDLRPTLFLAQLSNLLAGNISIVHGVTGSSRTFMGEEAAGVDAVRIALARIDRRAERYRACRRRAERRAQGDADAVRVRRLQSQGCVSHPYGSARPNGGFALGSLGAFLVLESTRACGRRAAPSRSRGSPACSPIARTASPATLRATLGSAVGEAARPIDAGHAAVISGATGAEPATVEERTFLGAPARTPGARHRHPYRPRSRAQFADERRARRTCAGRMVSCFAMRRTRSSSSRRRWRRRRWSSPASGTGAAKGLALVEREP